MNSHQLNDHLRKAKPGERDTLRLLRKELKGPRRASQIKRLYVRYARMRRDRELKEFLGRAKSYV